MGKLTAVTISTTAITTRSSKRTIFIWRRARTRGKVTWERSNRSGHAIDVAITKLFSHLNFRRGWRCLNIRIIWSKGSGNKISAVVQMFFNAARWPGGARGSRLKNSQTTDLIWPDLTDIHHRSGLISEAYLLCIIICMNHSMCDISWETSRSCQQRFDSSSSFIRELLYKILTKYWYMIVYGTNIVKRIWTFDENLGDSGNFRRFKMNYCNAYFRRKKKKDRLYFSRLRSILYESSDLIAFIISDSWLH